MCLEYFGKQVMDYLTKNLNESFTLDLIAQVTDYSLYYLWTITTCFVVGFYTAIIIENIVIPLLSELFIELYIDLIQREESSRIYITDNIIKKSIIHHIQKLW